MIHGLYKMNEIKSMKVIILVITGIICCILTKVQPYPIEQEIRNLPIEPPTGESDNVMSQTKYQDFYLGDDHQMKGDANRENEIISKLYEENEQNEDVNVIKKTKLSRIPDEQEEYQEAQELNEHQNENKETSETTEKYTEKNNISIQIENKREAQENIFHDKDGIIKQEANLHVPSEAADVSVSSDVSGETPVSEEVSVPAPSESADVSVSLDVSGETPVSEEVSVPAPSESADVSLRHDMHTVTVVNHLVSSRDSASSLDVASADDIDWVRGVSESLMVTESSFSSSSVSDFTFPVNSEFPITVLSSPQSFFVTPSTDISPTSSAFQSTVSQSIYSSASASSMGNFSIVTAPDIIDPVTDVHLASTTSSPSAIYPDGINNLKSTQVPLSGIVKIIDDEYFQYGDGLHVNKMSTSLPVTTTSSYSVKNSIRMNIVNVAQSNKLEFKQGFTMGFILLCILMIMLILSVILFLVWMRHRRSKYSGTITLTHIEENDNDTSTSRLSRHKYKTKRIKHEAFATEEQLVNEEDQNSTSRLKVTPALQKRLELRRKQHERAKLLAQESLLSTGDNDPCDCGFNLRSASPEHLCLTANPDKDVVLVGAWRRQSADSSSDNAAHLNHDGQHSAVYDNDRSERCINSLSMVNANSIGPNEITQDYSDKTLRKPSINSKAWKYIDEN